MTDGMPFHPIANEYPLLDEDELAELAEHIAENGQLIRVCMLDGLIIDGRNRYLACQRLGIECNTFDYQGDRDENALRRYIAGLNEHRRHLTPAWLSDHRKQRVERIAAARENGASLRAIAEAERISESQVRRDLELSANSVSGAPSPGAPEKAVESGHQISGAPSPGAPEKVEPKKVAGRDGKSYPAAKEGNGATVGDRKKTTAKPEADPVESVPIRDPFGQSIPPAFLAAWAAREELVKIARILGQAEKKISTLCQDCSGAAHELRAATTLRVSKIKDKDEERQTFRLDELHQARKKVDFAVPYTICPYCWHEHSGRADKECVSCHGSGLVSKIKFNAAAEEFKLAVKNRDKIAGEAAES